VRGRQLKTENAVALKSFRQLNFRYLIEGYKNAIISILNKSETEEDRAETDEIKFQMSKGTCFLT